jgi:polyphosphate kinase 2 (PPK2 family)
LRRLNKEKHNWKFAPEDVKEREYWEEYQKYYEEAVNQTSKSNAPWYVIPADDKAICRYIFAKILREVFKKYTDIRLPELRDEIKQDLELYKQRLLEE